MNDVKRYAPIAVFEGVREPYAELEQCNLGQSVKFTDYQALQAENERLKTYGRHLMMCIKNHPIANPHGYETITKVEEEFGCLTVRHENKLKADAVETAAQLMLSNYEECLEQEHIRCFDFLMLHANKLEKGDD